MAFFYPLEFKQSSTLVATMIGPVYDNCVSRIINKQLLLTFKSDRGDKSYGHLTYSIEGKLEHSGY